MCTYFTTQLARTLTSRVATRARVRYVALLVRLYRYTKWWCVLSQPEEEEEFDRSVFSKKNEEKETSSRTDLMELDAREVLLR